MRKRAVKCAQQVEALPHARRGRTERRGRGSGSGRYAGTSVFFQVRGQRSHKCTRPPLERRAQRIAARGRQPRWRWTRSTSCLHRRSCRPSIRYRDRRIACRDRGAHAALQGWLTKLGEKVKNWKRRYFILRAGVVYYYKKNDVRKPIAEAVALSRGTRRPSPRA